MMPRFLAGVCLAAALLAACSPTYNWREMRVEPTRLKAMMPCKPDHATREVPMAGKTVSLTVLGCETGGATFAVLNADLGDATRSGEVLSQWKAATLANLHTAASRDLPFVPNGAMNIPQSVQVIASGKRADGSTVESHAAYFAQGTQVFQAVIYADKLKPEAAEPFFSGLRIE